MEHIQKTPVRYRRNSEQVQELLNLFAKSDLSVKDFCRQHSISPANFYKWRSRYKSNPVRKKKSGFATLAIASSSSALQGLFAEVKGIKIFQPVSASFLKELLA